MPEKFPLRVLFLFAPDGAGKNRFSIYEIASSKRTVRGIVGYNCGGGVKGQQTNNKAHGWRQ